MRLQSFQLVEVCDAVHPAANVIEATAYVRTREILHTRQCSCAYFPHPTIPSNRRMLHLLAVRTPTGLRVSRVPRESFAGVLRCRLVVLGKGKHWTVAFLRPYLAQKAEENVAGGSPFSAGETC